jgi:hypothetical protein
MIRWVKGLGRRAAGLRLLRHDTATLLKGLDDIGWTVRMIGNGTMGVDMRRTIDIGGEESVKTVTALNYKSFTYCSLSEHTKYGEFVDRPAPGDARQGLETPAVGNRLGL